MPPGTKNGGQRLAPAVLVVIEEDLAGAAHHRPLERNLTGPLLEGIAAYGLSDGSGGVVVELPNDRQIEVQTGATRGLGVDLEAEAGKQVPQPQSEITGLPERF